MNINGIGGNSSNGTDGIFKMMMMANMMKGSGDEAGKSFNIAFSCLLNALQEKQGYNKVHNESTNNDLTHITDMIFRPNFGGLNGVNEKGEVSKELISDNEKIEAAIKKASDKHGISEKVIRTIIKLESEFNPNVTSWAGAMGLMQIMPETAAQYGVKNPYDIEENIDAGTKHIKDYLNLYNGNLEMALAGYNCGCGTMSSRGVKSAADFYKLPEETINYISKFRKYL